MTTTEVTEGRKNTTRRKEANRSGTFSRKTASPSEPAVPTIEHTTVMISVFWNAFQNFASPTSVAKFSKPTNEMAFIPFHSARLKYMEKRMGSSWKMRNPRKNGPMNK